MSFLYAVVFGGFVAFANYLPTYIKTIYGFSTVDAGARTAGFALAAVLARPIGGALADRIAPKYVVLASFAGTAAMAFVAVFQPPPDVWSAATFITLAIFLGIGTGGVFAWVARRAPAQSVGSVTGIVAAAGGLGGYFPPLVMGATYDPVHNDYTIGLLLLVATALLALGYTGPAAARPRTERPQGDRDVTTTPHAGGRIEELLGRSGRFFTPGEFSDDLRTVTRRGGREGDVFYRDRWSHDKVVRSTHGVNCTGSCSWKIYVKDGIITWETQETDYPSVGPDRPEYEPRGCPRGAAFSWYTYSPTRVRYPYGRGVLVEMYREAKARLGDPVLAWADIQSDPERRRRYHQARGKGGLVRVTWAEATEMIAAAHVHTIKTYGPDRVAGFSPIPAMSMVSHAAGSRFVELLGGAMTSFYDWYADLPVASPQVFGDQTDVPESGDWWDAAYLMMWGSNVPVTRTPDAHWMAEVRYRGTKVVSVSPDYADNTKFADEWMPCAAGTDGALAMAMGHVILSESFVNKRVPFFVDYVRRYTDLPFLVKLEQRGDTLVPGKNLTAADLGHDVENAAFKPVLLDGASDTVAVPHGSLGFRYGDDGVGKWNLDLGDVSPALTVAAGPGDAETALIALPRFDSIDGHGETLARGVPVRRVGEHLVCTVFDLMLAQYGVARPGLPGDWPTGYDDPDHPYTPAWQEAITGVSAAQTIRIAREFARNAEESGGRSMIIMGAGSASGSTATPPTGRCWPCCCSPDRWDAMVAAGRTMSVRRSAVRSPGGPRWRWPPTGRVRRARWPAPPTGMPTPTSGATTATGPTRWPARWAAAGSRASTPWMCWPPRWRWGGPRSIRSSTAPASTSPTRPAPPDARSGDYVTEQLASGALKLAVTDPDNPANWPRVLNVWRANLLGSSSKGNEYFLRHLLGTTSNLQAQPTPEALRPNDIAWTDDIPEGKLDMLMSIDFRMTSTTLLSDVVLPAATWYEKADLSSTDMHPYVHAFSPAIDPPWETRSDYEAFGAIARAFSTLAAQHLGTRTDVVLGTLQHDTPGAMAYPGGTEHDWRVTGETPVPGQDHRPDRGGGT